MNFKSVLFAIIFCNSFVNCYSQKYNKFILKIPQFNKSAKKNNSYQIQKNDSIFKFSKTLYGYEVIGFRKNKSNIYKKYLYNKKGKLIQESSFYKTLPIDLQKNYDTNGHIILISDFSRPEFTYKIEDLLKDMDRDFNVDSYNSQTIEIIPYKNKRDGLEKYFWIIVDTGGIIFIDGQGSGEMIIK